MKLSYAVCFLLLAGCGSGTYEEVASQRLSDLEAGAKYVGLLDAEIPKTSIHVRVPKVFVMNAFDESSADPQFTDQKIDLRRFQPPMVKLPGQRITFEGKQPGKDQDATLYCYLAALTTTKTPSPADDLLRQVKAKFPKAAWEEISIPPAPGVVPLASKTPNKWRRIQVEGRMYFDVKPANGEEDYHEMEGHFELYLFEGANYYVMIGWRVPDEVTVKPNLTALAETTASTLTSE